MKPILAFTDFSTEHETSLFFAAWLSRKLGSRLLLIHVYSLPVIMNDMIIPIIPYEELQKSAEENMQKIKNKLANHFNDVEITIEVKIGDIVDEVTRLSKKLDPLMIVLGSQGEKDDSIFGSPVMSVIRNTTTPVLVIPEGYARFQITKAVLASDLNSATTPVQKIIEIVQKLNTELHVVHVYDKSFEANAENDLMAQLKEVEPVYHAVQDDDIAHGLQQYISEINADLLLVLPHDHNLVERFFFKLHTKELIHTSQTPVLCVHE